MNFVAVPIAFFAFLTIVMVLPAWLRYRSHRDALHVISEAAAKGYAPDTALIERLLARPRRPVGKWFALALLVVGVLSLSIGTALTLGYYFLEINGGIPIGALMNLSIGTGFVTLGAVIWRLFSGQRQPEPIWNYVAILALICLFLGVSGISIGIALTLAVSVAGAGGKDIWIAVLVNSSYGIGFTALGSIMFRTFAGYEEAGVDRGKS